MPRRTNRKLPTEGQYLLGARNVGLADHHDRPVTGGCCGSLGEFGSPRHFGTEQATGAPPLKRFGPLSQAYGFLVPVQPLRCRFEDEDAAKQTAGSKRLQRSRGTQRSGRSTCGFHYLRQLPARAQDATVAPLQRTAAHEAKQLGENGAHPGYETQPIAEPTRGPKQA
jgi:hypothetical protein